MGHFSTLLKHLNLIYLVPRIMRTKASTTQGEESTQTEAKHAARRSSRPASPTLSKTAANYKEDAGIILGLSRYGHPYGPVYLPTDHGAQPLL